MMVSGVRRSCANAAFRRLRSSAVRHSARCDSANEARMASNDEARWPSSSSRSYDTENSRFCSAMLDAARSSTSNPGWRRLPKKRRAAAKMHRPNHSGNMRNVSSSSAEDSACASSDGGVFT